jgi:hypothetical protein
MLKALRLHFFSLMYVEASIIILSLVRNSGSMKDEQERATVSNVAIHWLSQKP